MPHIPSDLMEHFPYFAKYPHSLLSAILHGTKLTAPNAYSQDVLSGIQHTFLKLDPSTQKLLWLRYVQMLSASTVANYLSITEAELNTIEQSAIISFRRSGTWGYIRHGIEGNLRIKLQESRRAAYHSGYCDGYKAAATHAGLDLSQSHSASEVLDYAIEILPLSERAKHCLQNNGLSSIQDIIGLTEQQILGMRGLGKQCANEIASALHSYQILHTAWDKYLL